MCGLCGFPQKIVRPPKLPLNPSRLLGRRGPQSALATAATATACYVRHVRRLSDMSKGTNVAQPSTGLSPRIFFGVTAVGWHH